MQTLTLSSVETTFTYNSNGFRTNKTTGDVSHDYIWSGDTLLAEVTDDYILRFIHDEAGNIIGFEHHLAELNEDGETVYVLDATYYYEKNIFGDVIAIYDEAGNHPVAVYAYNAYGQCHVLDNYTDAAIGSLNPIRYRSYYYDADTYLYYLQSRYYDPVACRFVNPDAFINANGDILGYNMFAYCGNNPIMGYDPTGLWLQGFWEDNGANLVEALLEGAEASVSVYAITDSRLLSSIAGITTSFISFCTTTNLQNAEYYTSLEDGVWIADEPVKPEDEKVDTSGWESAYTKRYVSRKERLAHARAATDSSTYDLNTWRYYSEYSVHMYGWYLTGWSKDMNIPVISGWAGSFKYADVERYDLDKRDYVNVATFVWGLTGL